MQFDAVGSRLRRLAAIGSPQLRQYPYSSSAMRFSAASARLTSNVRRRPISLAISCCCIASMRDRRPIRLWSSSTGPCSVVLARRKSSSRRSVRRLVSSAKSMSVRPSMGQFRTAVLSTPSVAAKLSLRRYLQVRPPALRVCHEFGPLRQNPWLPAQLYDRQSCGRNPIQPLLVHWTRCV